MLISAAWVQSWRAERRKKQRSPWDMADEEVQPAIDDYLEALQQYRFDTPAVGIRSAEGWHERYDWDDNKQRAAVAALQSSTSLTCADLDTVCALHTGCATQRAGTSR
ncbi:YD repeat-containing protein [Kribbella orskensis]|uniref:YD repeat-containing protein n=1 Tax=Kribbella orskensis TaxID=2512216 RepID=A0ABY2B9L8_9ACTN|nr:MULTISPECIES: hypothetical protein [Kribbella]TCN32797.1 YD repeat-containing protein [Kribbella sp. VKM Ac-2500]TCO12885.1 YD repeat-containing protein [Kribbella orskensis]